MFYLHIELKCSVTKLPNIFFSNKQTANVMALAHFFILAKFLKVFRNALDWSRRQLMDDIKAISAFNYITIWKSQRTPQHCLFLFINTRLRLPAHQTSALSPGPIPIKIFSASIDWPDTHFTKFTIGQKH